MKVLFFLFLLAPFICLSQELVLPKTNIAITKNASVISSAVLGENIIGPRKILFFGDQLDLQRKEEGNSSSRNNVKGVFELLPTHFSGRIHSPGIIEPFIFTDKSPAEMLLMEVTVFPIHLEEPYTLFIDLEVKTSPKSKPDNQSFDAGIYNAIINVNLTEI